MFPFSDCLLTVTCNHKEDRLPIIDFVKYQKQEGTFYTENWNGEKFVQVFITSLNC